MNEYTLITRIPVKIMSLVFCHGEQRIIEHIIRIKINEVLPLSLFEPYDLVEAVYMRPGGVTLMLFYIAV